VTPIGSRQAAVFASDWAGLLGTSDAALMSGVWDERVGNGRLSAIVTAAGLGFPTGNAFEVNGVRHSSYQTIVADELRYVNRETVPVGGSRYYRLYKRVVWPANLPSLGNNNHSIEEAPGDLQNWGFATHINSAGWSPRFRSMIGGALQGGYYVLQSGGAAVWLPRNATYRLEWQVERLTTTTFRVRIRVYDPSGQLRYTDADFQSSAGAGSLTNATFQMNNPNGLGGITVGTNGPSADVAGNVTPMWYFGGVCLRRDGWCGPYNTSDK
jgi:hypothetical protein